MSSRWGIIPAAGRGTRIQPLAFSKELLPVGTRHDGGTERPRAVTEYLLERMTSARVNRICFVISAEKTDIVRYFGARIAEAPICYTAQQNPHAPPGRRLTVTGGAAARHQPLVALQQARPARHLGVRVSPPN